MKIAKELQQYIAFFHFQITFQIDKKGTEKDIRKTLENKINLACFFPLNRKNI